MDHFSTNMAQNDSELADEMFRTSAVPDALSVVVHEVVPAPHIIITLLHYYIIIIHRSDRAMHFHMQAKRHQAGRPQAGRQQVG
eukprot:COSAG06_NODE_3195_length_5703_cov_94.949143_3_plen_84_part_00